MTGRDSGPGGGDSSTGTDSGEADSGYHDHDAGPYDAGPVDTRCLSVEDCNPDECALEGPIDSQQCYLVIPATELWVHADGYFNRPIEIIPAWASNDDLACTALECTEGDDPCCNTCAGPLYIQDTPFERHRIPIAHSTGAAGCFGTNCSPRQSCFMEPDQFYRVYGTFENDGLHGILRVAGFDVYVPDADAGVADAGAVDSGGG